MLTVCPLLQALGLFLPPALFLSKVTRNSATCPCPLPLQLSRTTLCQTLWAMLSAQPPAPCTALSVRHARGLPVLLQVLPSPASCCMAPDQGS